ncbi:lipoprotein-releasing ABC transporter ATP-binding protein LolD [Kistimonas scapharcae]|uniref:Lipoprotein-releasing ABC transporter ATP-binding protein LolD n=1 Tax=Kistimonas scapharcae TaxID=1036133 RepID=A0ABP8V8U7_9GAMM
MSKDVVLECRELGKVYREGPGDVEVIRDVSFAVGRSERIAIVGSSGSGKTTLLNLLAGLDVASRGEVCVCGVSLNGLNDREKSALRNRHLGFVYQFHHLLPEFSARENVAMPLLMRRDVAVSVAAQKAEELLTLVGLEARLDHKPGELSGGERQRVAIARALVTEPDLVLLDEPTGNLDQHTAEVVQGLIMDLSQRLQTSFIIVTHDLSLAAKMDRIWQLQDGGLVEQVSNSGL